MERVDKGSPPASAPGRPVNAAAETTTRPEPGSGGDWPFVALACLAAALLRTVFLYPQVFLPSRVNFTEPDVWYHMRLIDALVSEFPRRVTLDPYAASGGAFIPIAPFLEYLVAGASLLLGLGAPSQRLTETVAATMPVVLGALVVVPAYFIARLTFGRRAGVIAAALTAVMPGAYLDRTKLGSTDHHVLEILLSATTMLFLMAASRDVDRHTAIQRVRSLLLPVLAGLAWGGYMLSWTSGWGLSLILCAWVVVQNIVDHAQGRATPLIRTVVPAASVALALVLLFEDPSAARYMLRVVLPLAVIALTVILAGLRWAAAAAHLAPTHFLVGLGTLAGACGVAFVAAAPEMSGAVWQELFRLLSDTADTTVGEVRPLFFLEGTGFTLTGPWTQFRTAFFIGLVGLALLLVRIWREAGGPTVLMVVWTMAVLVATMGQMRFSYYLAVNLAILSAGVCGAIIERAEGDARTRTVKKKEPRGRFADRAAAESWTSSAWAAVALVVFLPAVSASLEQVERTAGMPSPWHDALQWLRLHTPEPFTRPDTYVSPRIVDGKVEAPAYTVLGSWEVGYWIAREGRRVPVSNPTQSGFQVTAQYLTATATARADELATAVGARYIALSDDLLFVPNEGGAAGKFGQLPTMLNEPTSRFYETFIDARNRNAPTRKTFYFKDYYESMAVRLMHFGGRPIAPTLVTVISWVSATDAGGQPVKVLTAAREFTSYQEATAYMASLPAGDHAIASNDPLATCVPLEEASGYRLAFESSDSASSTTGHGTVRIFDRAPSAVLGNGP